MAITRVILHAGSLILSSCNKLKKASVHSSVLLLLLLLFFDNNNRAGSNKRSFVGHPRSSLARVPAITLASSTAVTPVTRTPYEVVAERRSSLSALCACCVNFVIYNFFTRILLVGGIYGPRECHRRAESGMVTPRSSQHHMMT